MLLSWWAIIRRVDWLERKAGTLLRDNWLSKSSAYIKWYSFGGKIVSHRPHPDPDLMSLILKFMGKRIHTWFGWSVETFVLKR
jgi:hypothetical protein